MVVAVSIRILLLVAFSTVSFLSSWTTTTTTTTTVDAKEFKVALWGDLPYQGSSDNIFDTKDTFGTKYREFRNSINDHIEKNGVTISFHAGDIKSGSTPCTPLYYNRFIDLANSLNVPTLVSIGDNEWTDCHESNKNPLERLRYTRSRLYNNRTSSTSTTVQSKLGRGTTTTISLLGQSTVPYLENQYIIRDGIIFALLHVTGSNNNNRENTNSCVQTLHRIDRNCVAANAEYVARDRAVNRALVQIFDKAKEQKLKGVVIVIQAHFWGGTTAQCNAQKITVQNAESKVSSGYKNFMKTFMTEVSNYNTLGDVVVVHGDAHFYRLCYPTIYSNVAFVMVPGATDISWVLATIDSEQPVNEIFKFQHIQRPFQPL